MNTNAKFPAFLLNPAVSIFEWVRREARLVPVLPGLLAADLPNRHDLQLLGLPQLCLNPSRHDSATSKPTNPDL
jgi:hypothetical protein